MKTKFMKKAAVLISSILLMSPNSTNCIFASSSYPAGGAYSIGGDFHNGDDVRSACDYWAMCGYSSYYNTNPSYSYLNSNRLNAYVVYFSSHGNQHSIHLPNNLKLSDGRITADSNTVEISNFQLDRPRLYVYDACLTASNEDGTGINLCTKTINAGVDCVIGWTKSIGVQDAYDWERRFQNQLALGWTVQNAANYANGFNYNNNTTIKSWNIYGNNNIVIKTSAYAANNSNIEPYVERDSFEYYDWSENSYYVGDYSLNDYDNLLSSKFENFEEESYDKTYTYTNVDETDYVIDYTLKCGDYKTKIGYTIVVDDDMIVGIQSNNTDSAKVVNEKSVYEIPEITEIAKENAIKNACSEVKKNCIITDQTGEAYYDCLSDTYYYRVKTVYRDAEGGFGSFFTFEEIK